MEYECGCITTFYPISRECGVKYCPLHKAAPDMLEAIETWLDKETPVSIRYKTNLLIEAISKARGEK